MRASCRPDASSVSARHCAAAPRRAAWPGCPGGRWLMGQSAQALFEGIGAWTGSRSVGVIAGSLPFGLGAAMGALGAPHDGTVAVEETRLPGIADHCTITTSHTGLLFSSEVADLTIGFLRTGRFAAESR